ncbi:MAG: UrcA family protein [Pseudomonadota bacterium]
MTLPKSLTTLLGSALALSILPAVAGTAPDTDSKSLEISLAGFDLSDPSDAKIVYSKIQSTAKRVCSRSTARQTLRQHADEMRCRADAVTQAILALDEPVLTLVMTESDSAS